MTMTGRCIGRWWLLLGWLASGAGVAQTESGASAAAGPASAASAASPAKPAQRFLPIQSAVISPDGRHVAAVVYRNFGNQLELIDTTDFSHRTVLWSKWVKDGNYMVRRDPLRVTWINPELLAVDYPFSAEAVDLAGQHVADLGTRVIGHIGWQTPNEPRMLVFDDEDHSSVSVIQARTRDKRRVRVSLPGDPVSWAFDGRGELRSVVMASSGLWADNTTLSYWYRRLGSDQWTRLDEAPLTDGDHWVPLAASSSEDELTVLSREGRDTWAVFAYDPIQRKMLRMLAGSPTEDMRVVNDLQADQVRGAINFGMKPTMLWFDARMTELQSEVDKALPGRINRISGPPEGKVLIHSFSDVDPGRWYLLDTRDWTMKKLLEAFTGTDLAQMRPMQALSYKAADGLSIPAYLTRPAGDSGPRPMVVLVHGGPALRDQWGWDAEVQMLAAQGYVVFQPQFRGSAGFGKAFERAGHGQWGLAMQDDITTGVEQMIAQGIADPQRICIYGASYGGYAAVWGLIKTPELYRCGVSFAGVSDIAYMLTDRSDRNSDKQVREIQRFKIGNLERDKARFDQVSPLRHADRIRAPLLIAHGEYDKRVPPSHSRKLMKAMDESRKPYVWVELENEGHGLSSPYSRTQFYAALLAFLDKHIGSGAKP